MSQVLPIPGGATPGVMTLAIFPFFSQKVLLGPSFSRKIGGSSPAPSVPTPVGGLKLSPGGVKNLFFPGIIWGKGNGVPHPPKGPPGV